MADEDTDTTDVSAETPAAPDYSEFVPESFKKEDGTWDTGGFRTAYDEALAFKGQVDDQRAALPQEASGYEFALPEDFQLPEGFDAEALSHVDDDGNKVEFDVASMIDAEDPDIPIAQDIMHRIGQGELSPVDAMKEFAGIMVSRELRGVMDAQRVASEQKQALGPNADARIATVTRAIAGMVPGDQARALADSITSADALRGFEALIKNSPKPVNPAPGGKDYASMSPLERIVQGMETRGKKRA